MPEDHLRKAVYNESFARFLDDKWPAWGITALFYSGMHFAQAFLVECGHTPEKHTERNDLLRMWPTVRNPYMRLFDYGHKARYRCDDQSIERVTNATAYLSDVKAAIRHEWPGTAPGQLG